MRYERQIFGGFEKREEERESRSRARSRRRREKEVCKTSRRRASDTKVASAVRVTEWWNLERIEDMINSFLY